MTPPDRPVKQKARRHRFPIVSRNLHGPRGHSWIVQPIAATRPLERRFYRLMMMDRYLWRGAHSSSPRFAAKQALVEELHAVQGFDQPRAPDPIPEIAAEELTAERFWALSEGLTRVVVIRGFGHTRAHRTWTPQALADRFANERCAVIEYDEGSLERGWDTGAELVEMGVPELLRRMQDEPLYLSNSTELVAKDPSLIDDLELPRIRDALLPDSRGWDELVSTNFFISSRNVYTSMHHAPGGNFFLQVAGRKRWYLIDPKWTAWVHPVNGRPFQYCNSAFAGFQARRRMGVPNPLANLPHSIVTLEPGDLLYNAPWWWHEIENLDAFTVGCAVRHVPRPGRRSPSWANHRLFTATSLYPVMRALSFAHYARQRLTGSTTPMREGFNAMLTALLYRSFRRRRAAAAVSVAAVPAGRERSSRA